MLEQIALVGRIVHGELSDEENTVGKCPEKIRGPIVRDFQDKFSGVGFLLGKCPGGNCPG